MCLCCHCAVACIRLLYSLVFECTIGMLIVVFIVLWCVLVAVCNFQFLTGMVFVTAIAD